MNLARNTMATLVAAVVVLLGMAAPAQAADQVVKNDSRSIGTGNVSYEGVTFLAVRGVAELRAVHGPYGGWEHYSRVKARLAADMTILNVNKTLLEFVAQAKSKSAGAYTKYRRASISVYSFGFKVSDSGSTYAKLGFPGYDMGGPFGTTIHRPGLSWTVYERNYTVGVYGFSVNLKARVVANQDTGLGAYTPLVAGNHVKAKIYGNHRIWCIGAFRASQDFGPTRAEITGNVKFLDRGFAASMTSVDHSFSGSLKWLADPLNVVLKLRLKYYSLSARNWVTYKTYKIFDEKLPAVSFTLAAF